MLDTNFAYTKEVFFWCQAKRVPLIYASSAAIYGKGSEFREFGAGEGPLNVYGWSKWMFDSWLRPKIGAVAAPVTGLRYFNVYGPGEAHKGAWRASSISSIARSARTAARTLCRLARLRRRRAAARLRLCRRRRQGEPLGR